MHRTRVRLVAITTLAVTLPMTHPTPLGAQGAAAARTAPPVRYEIAFPNAAHHEAAVAVTFTRVPAGALQLRMSRSSPGRYALHEFAKNVYALEATDSRGRPLAVRQPSPHQWNVSGHDGTVRVAYTLYGDRADGTYAGIDRSMAHLNMPATFLWARGMEARPVQVTFRAPDPAWTIATQLFPTRDSTIFTAPNLQYFLDSPTHLGRQSWHTWEVSDGGRTQTIGMSRQAPFTDAAVSIDPQNKANTFISYYPFGQAIALALDLELRQQGTTLDAFMRELWHVHGPQRNYAPVRPYAMPDLRRALARVARDEAFANDFLARYVEGQDVAGYESLLALGGFRIRQARASATWLGDVPLRHEGGKALVGANTLIGTPLYEAGVDRGDRIVSVDGRVLASADDLTAVLQAQRPGNVVPLVFESRGETITTQLTLAASPRIEIVPFESSGEPVTPAIVAFRRTWLGS